jgi:hypothetical protein
MMHNAALVGYGKAKVVYYSKDRVPFGSEIELQPISTRNMFGEINMTHFLGKVKCLLTDGDANCVPPTMSKSQLELYDWVQDHPLSDDEESLSDVDDEDNEAMSEYDNRSSTSSRHSNEGCLPNEAVFGFWWKTRVSLLQLERFV